MKILRKYSYPITLVVSGVVVIIFAIILNSLVNQYEQSILDVYATQQDAYVQLVLDQINLTDDRSDTEIIENILGTLDTSSKKYWTLTKEQALLFVKDVSETNRYKGFTSATYYVSDSAASFLSELTLNRIVHEIIEVEGFEYVASGVIFTYNGAEYKICLLTNTSVILDNNAFLSTKIRICIFSIFLLILLLIVSMYYATLFKKKNIMIDELNETIKEKNISIEQLGSTMRDYNYYNTRQHLFSAALLPKFLSKLNNKRVAPLTIMCVTFKNDLNRRDFLDKATVLLDDKVLRFYDKNHSLVLIFIYGTEANSLSACEQIKVEYEVTKLIVHTDVHASLMEECEAILNN